MTTSPAAALATMTTGVRVPCHIRIPQSEPHTCALIKAAQINWSDGRGSALYGTAPSTPTCAPLNMAVRASYGFAMFSRFTNETDTSAITATGPSCSGSTTLSRSRRVG